MLLANKKLANTKDSEGLTLLHLAAKGGHYEVVRMLLGFKANPKAKAANDVTPLHLAAQSGNKDVVTFLLLVKDVKVEQEDKHKSRPSMYAEQAGHSELADFLKTREDEAIEKRRAERRAMWARIAMAAAEGAATSVANANSQEQADNTSSSKAEAKTNAPQREESQSKSDAVSHVVTSPAVPAGENLLKNPGFESGALTPWEGLDPGGLSVRNHPVSSRSGFRSNYVAEVQVRSQSKETSLYQNVNAESPGTYVFSAEVWGTLGADQEIRLVMWEYGLNKPSEQSYRVLMDRKTLNVTLTKINAKSWLRVEIYPDRKNPQTFYVDNAKLVKIN